MEQHHLKSALHVSDVRISYDVMIMNRRETSSVTTYYTLGSLNSSPVQGDRACSVLPLAVHHMHIAEQCNRCGAV